MHEAMTKLARIREGSGERLKPDEAGALLDGIGLLIIQGQERESYEPDIEDMTLFDLLEDFKYGEVTRKKQRLVN